MGACGAKLHGVKAALGSQSSHRQPKKRSNPLDAGMEKNTSQGPRLKGSGVRSRVNMLEK